MLNFLLFIFLSFTLQAEAEKVSTVEEHLRKIVVEQVRNECRTCEVEMQIHNKQVIEDIAIPDKVVADHWKGQTNLILQMDGKNRVVTVTIRWMDQVVIAKENIRQGQPLAEKDLRVVTKDVTYIKEAYARSFDQVIGLLGKSVFRSGQVIDETYLKKPLAIRYGQPIKLELMEGKLKVVVNGQARGAGAVGDQIPVFIPNTQKKLMARIVDEGTVRVE